MLSVLCGTVGLYEVEVPITGDHLAAYQSEGLNAIKRLAADVTLHPSRYLP